MCWHSVFLSADLAICHQQWAGIKTMLNFGFATVRVCHTLREANSCCACLLNFPSFAYALKGRRSEESRVLHKRGVVRSAFGRTIPSAPLVKSPKAQSSPIQSSGRAVGRLEQGEVHTGKMWKWMKDNTASLWTAHWSIQGPKVWLVLYFSFIPSLSSWEI